MSNLIELKKKIAFRFTLAIIFTLGILFIPAGSIFFWPAWIYCGILFPSMAFIIFYFFKKDPALLQRRLKMSEKEKPQKIIMSFIGINFLIALLIPGLDFRFNNPNLNILYIGAADLAVILGYALIFVVFKTNSYAGRTIEVSEKQKVISTGPYKIIRHPMYLGAILVSYATPIALGSILAFYFFMPLIIPLIFRILNEEKILKKELPGYNEYCQKTPYRLIPFIW